MKHFLCNNILWLSLLFFSGESSIFASIIRFFLYLRCFSPNHFCNCAYLQQCVHTLNSKEIINNIQQPKWITFWNIQENLKKFWALSSKAFLLRNPCVNEDHKNRVNEDHKNRSFISKKQQTDIKAVFVFLTSLNKNNFDEQKQKDRFLLVETK